MKCILRIKDEVNVKFEQVDPATRRKVHSALRFNVPYARHTQSYKMGRWDGKVNFANIGGSTFLNLLEDVLPIVINAGYEIDIVDERTPIKLNFPKDVDQNLIAYKTWPEGHPAENQPIVLRDYQVEAIKTYFENPQSIQCLSTGSGKTILTAVLSLLCEPYGRTLVIVPSKSLVTQTEEDYLNLGLDVGVFYGERKDYNKKHTISTWQSLGSFCKKKDDFSDVDVSFNQFIDGVQCVMVDECHSAKSAVLKSLLTGPLAHVPIRWGMTGTVPKEDFDYYALLSSVGPVVGEVKAKDLQDQGVLANCDISIMQLDDSHVSYKTYPDEHNFLCTDERRLGYIANFTSKLEGNTLLLVDRIATAEFFQETIPEATVISGATKMEDRKKEFDEVKISNDKIIIATYGVAAVGLNLPKINNMVCIEMGKSFVRTIQAIGRTLRKADGKDTANIYDFCSNLKFSKSHLTKRKKYYKEAEYPHHVKKISYW